MDQKIHARFKAQAKVLKALGHPTRLFIVDQLAKEERCVADLTQMIGVEMSTVSKHLSLLRDAGLIEGDKRGSQIFYRVSVPCVVDFFRCVEAVRGGESI